MHCITVYTVWCGGHKMIVHRDGNLHSATWNTPTVRVYTPSGVLVCTYTPPSSTHSDGLFIDKAGNRLVVDRDNPSKVIITDKNNNLINKLATGEGQYTYQVAIAPMIYSE